VAVGVLTKGTWSAEEKSTKTSHTRAWRFSRSSPLWDALEHIFASLTEQLQFGSTYLSLDIRQRLLFLLFL
jgi:hypothetical protein